MVGRIISQYKILETLGGGMGVGYVYAVAGRRREALDILARIMHRFSSRSAESAGLTRRATEAPASVLYGTFSVLLHRYGNVR